MDLSKVYGFWTFLLVVYINVKDTQEEESHGTPKSSVKRSKDLKRLIFSSHADRKAFAAENIDKVRSHQKHLRRLIRTMISNNSCDERKTDEVVRMLSQGRFDSTAGVQEMEKMRERLGNLTILCTVRHKKRRRHLLRSGQLSSAPRVVKAGKDKTPPKPARFTCTEDIKSFNISQLKGIEEEMKKDKCWNETDAHVVTRIQQLDKSERVNFRSNRMKVIRLKCKLMKRYHKCQQEERDKHQPKPLPRNPIQEEFWNNFGYPDLDEDEAMGLLFY